MSASAPVIPAPRSPILRPYQLEAHAAILVGYREHGVNRQLVALPTGLGKTVVLAGVPKLLAIPATEATLIIAHREELIDQTVAKVRDADPKAWVDVEMAERRASPMATVIVASVSSLQGKRLGEFMQRFGDRISLCIIDECHHAASVSYLNVVTALTAAREDMLIVGFTATPQRSDNVALSVVFDKVVYHKDIRWAMQQGWLVPVACWAIKTHTSLAGVEVRHGEYAQDQLEEAVNTDERNEEIVSAYLQHAPNKKSIAFCVGVAHAKELARVFCKAGVSAESVDGTTPRLERRAIFDRVRSGETRVLTNCGVATEGYDEPTIEVVIGARPTKSNLLYTQMAGRCLRPLDSVARVLGTTPTAEGRRALIQQSAKPEAIVMDVVDQVRRLSLVTFPSLWGLPPKLDPQGKRVVELAEKFDELAALDPAQAEQVEMFEQIEMAIEKIDPFALPDVPAEIQGFSEMSWMLVSHDAYRLTLPSRTVAKDVNGAIVKDFDRRLRDAERDERLAGSANPRDAAMASLRVSPSDVRAVKEFVEIRPDPLASYEVYFSSDRSERVLGVANDLASAFSRAEKWITANRPIVRTVLSKAAPWKAEPMKYQQYVLLRDEFAVPDDKMPRTKGEASLLIDKLVSRKSSAAKKKAQVQA